MSRSGRFGRDDLSIDWNPEHGGRSPGEMPQFENLDCAGVLDDWQNRVANLPLEIAFMQEEIAEKDKLMQACLSNISKCDNSIQKWIRLNGSQELNPKETQLSRIIKENYDRAEILQAEKIALAQKSQIIIDKHTRHLDRQLKALTDRGEFPNDPDIPSLLRPQIPERAPRVEPSAPAIPLSTISNPAGTQQRHPNQHPMRPLPAQVQAHHVSGGSSSAPATPAAILLQQRQAREASLGAAAIKRQKLTGGVGIPTSASSLARNSSLTPGTPRAGTPSGGRAGSVPRATQKGAANKKVAPHGSRQSGVPRKTKPGKSSLSRVKRTGTKNSPSSTNDSDLSDAETGSAEEEDEAVTPTGANKDGEGDDDMVDIDDDEGGDDRKYCTCQSVSYGDMVACDNDSCPYEWFHWSCVGLKSEPIGTWICPVCTKNMKK